MGEKKCVSAGSKVYVLFHTQNNEVSFDVFLDRKDARENIESQIEEAEERFRFEGLELSRGGDENSVTLYGFNEVYTNIQATERWEIVEKTLL